ncbi:hypothetical protein [Trinickia soli]|nr:hypothetical protein [Trinickia soli]CAB3727542.1 hypothetical protein LMG24076_05183 [Trinickia soli]
MPNAPSRWEPYCHRPDAEFHLSKFASEVLGHDAGVIFFDGSGATRLKSAMPDRDGDTTDLIVSVARPPLFPVAFQGKAQSQSFGHFAHDRIQATWPSADGVLTEARQAYSRATAPVARFIEGRKTVFDSVSTAVDVLGVMSGILAVAAIPAEGVAFAAALSILAGTASIALFVEDGQMLYFELTGDEMRKRQLANSWTYQLVESVAPWLALPDLAFSGLRTIKETARTALKVTALADRAEAATQRLASQRDAIAAYKEAHATKLEQSHIKTKTQRMQAKANRLTSDMRRTQTKLDAMSRKLKLLRTIGLPAYAGSAYGLGVYAVDPPDLQKAYQAVGDAVQGMGTHTTEPTLDLHHPARQLVPVHASARITGAVRPVMQFQVGVHSHTGASQ